MDPARRDIALGFADQRIEPTGLSIGLNLLIPLVGNKLLEPLAESNEFIARKPGNSGFELFDTHNWL